MTEITSVAIPVPASAGTVTVHWHVPMDDFLDAIDGREVTEGPRPFESQGRLCVSARVNVGDTVVTVIGSQDVTEPRVGVAAGP